MAAPDRPNVLLIVLDSAREDAFDPGGAEEGLTPAFADLHSMGGRQPRMRANACWTVPSHAAMLSGQLPRASGLIRAPGGRPQGCAPVLAAMSERMLPEVFRKAGYRSYGISANLWLSARSGFDVGFDHFDIVGSQRQSRLGSDSARERRSWKLEAVRGKADDGAGEAADMISARILEPRHRGQTDEPFFAFLNLVDSHSPYMPPKPWGGLSSRERAKAADEASEYLTMDAVWGACAGGIQVPEDALERMRKLYAGSIRQLDSWLGKLLDRLERLGMLDETIVVVTSDHGENLGEGGLMGHAYSLDERLLRVPFASSKSLVADGEDGATRSLASLPAMLADAAGIESHPWRLLEGSGEPSIAQFDPPGGRDHPRLREALESWGLGMEAAPLITTELTSATTADGAWKLVRWGEEERFFDLAADPLEVSPLDAAAAGGGGAPVEQLRAAIEPALPGAPGDASGDVTGGDPGEPVSDAEREQLEAQMRHLGYL